MCIVEPTVALICTGFSPDQAVFIDEPTKEDRTWNKSQQGGNHTAQSQTKALLLGRHATQANQKVCRLAGRTDKLEETHDSQKDEELFGAVHGTGTINHVLQLNGILDDRHSLRLHMVILPAICRSSWLHGTQRDY